MKIKKISKHENFDDNEVFLNVFDSIVSAFIVVFKVLGDVLAVVVESVVVSTSILQNPCFIMRLNCSWSLVEAIPTFFWLSDPLSMVKRQWRTTEKAMLKNRQI